MGRREREVKCPSFQLLSCMNFCSKEIILQQCSNERNVSPLLASHRYKEATKPCWGEQRRVTRSNADCNHSGENFTMRVQSCYSQWRNFHHLPSHPVSSQSFCVLHWHHPLGLDVCKRWSIHDSERNCLFKLIILLTSWDGMTRASQTMLMMQSTKLQKMFLDLPWVHTLADHSSSSENSFDVNSHCRVPKPRESVCWDAATTIFNSPIRSIISTLHTSTVGPTE